VRQVAKAGAMLMADAVAVERLEVLLRREVKQHHDEQHRRARQLPERCRVIGDGISRCVSQASNT